MKYLKILVALLIIAGLAFVGVSRIIELRKKSANAALAKIYPVVVRDMVPKIVDAKLTLPYLAEVENDKDVKLSSRIAARILEIKHSGTEVKIGDILATLDTTTIKSNLSTVRDQLKASIITLKNLKSTHKRTLELLKVQGASIEQSQTEETKIASMKANIEGLKDKERELQNDLSYATIKSPVNGVIAKTLARKGAMSMPGKPLLNISSNNGFYLMVRTPSEVPMQGVEFNGEDYPVVALGTTYHGLSEYKVYVKDKMLTTGDRVEVSVITFNQKGTLLPFDAILNRNGKNFVLVKDKNHAKPLEVNIIQSAEQGVVISESLKDKTIILAKPDILLRLTSGYALKVKE